MDAKRITKFLRRFATGLSCFGIGAFFLFYPAFPALAAESSSQPESVTLDAERVVYDDETGQASAVGDAVLTHGSGATIRAERIDYDAVTQKVKASPLPGKSVTMQAAGKTITGDGLEYDLNTGEGLLEGAAGTVPLGEGTLFIRGGGVEVLPYSLALERGLIGKRSSDEVSYVAQWSDVSATTCALDHPHYRIETKRITFVPGRRVIAQRPRLYLGNTYIFTYPMDYVALIERRALAYSITPYIQNSQNKGFGLGLSGALAWETGALSLGFAYADKVDFEWMAEIEQSLGAGFTVRAGVDYSWDKAWDEKIYHPYGSLSYETAGWKATVAWARDEYIEDQKDSLYEYRGRLDREPEVTVTSPWFKDPALTSSWLRLSAGWGAFKERTPVFANDRIQRYGAGLQSYVEFPVGKGFEMFWNVQYMAWLYDKDDEDQEIFEGIVGLRYGWDRLELATGYERRYTWGASPMLWDSYRETERIHQKLRFPVGRELYIALRGSYDLKESMVDEMNYALQWINDCMKWELAYYNDRTSGGDDKVGLSVSILAFPNTPASFGQYRNDDPFERPDDLPAP